MSLLCGTPTQTSNKGTREEKTMLYKELYRPQYHFSAPKGWLNDPNGLVWYKGEYHLFYQYYPHDILWGPMHWGHAVSTDLVHWENLPIALAPDENGTVFSGSVVVDHRNDSGLFSGGEGLVAFYTGHIDRPGQHPIEHQCLAYSEDCGRTWKKYEGNPILSAPETPDAYDFRDPKVFWHEESGKWVMFLGGGFYRVYNSSDLIHWDLTSESYIHEEFPDFALVPVENSDDKKWVLNLAGFKYYICSFDGKTFIREEGPYTADLSDGCQATQTFSNIQDGRVIMMSWMRDGSRGPTFPWRNTMTVARELTLRKMSDGTHRLVQIPVKELSALEAESIFELQDTDLEPGKDILNGVHCSQCVMEADLDISGKTGKTIFTILADDRQWTKLVVDLDNGLFFVDYTGGNSPRWRDTQTSMDAWYFATNDIIKARGKSYPVPLPDKDNLKVKALIDWTSMEIFLNDGLISFTFSVFPDAEADQLSLVSDDNIHVRSLSIKKMASIW